MPAKFRYHTKLSAPNSSGRCSVIIRVTFCSQRIELYTGIAVKPRQWNDGKERVKQGVAVDGYQYNVLNAQIDEQEQFVEAYFNDAALRSTPAGLPDLKERFNKKFRSSPQEMSDEFFFLFEEFIKEKSDERHWGENMREVFYGLKNKIRVFKPDMKFSDLSTSTMNALTAHLSKTMYNDALLKNLSYFKQFVSWAEKRKHYKIHEEYAAYSPKLPKAKKAVRYLTLDELNTIYNLQFGDKDGMERARDIFCFQCYTALRVSDVQQLKRENIVRHENGDYYLDLLTEKDDDRVTYKLATRAVQIYLKYKNNVYENDLAFPVISLQKYNDHLKAIGKLANLEGEWIDYEYRLNEKITVRTPKHELSSHTARRTFIVAALNEGMSLDLVSLITSHSDVAAMKPYIKMTTRGTDKVIAAIDAATL